MMADSLAAPIANFLYAWRFDNWLGCNPSHEPLSARTRKGLYMLIRIAVPACGKTRDSMISEALRRAGYEVVEDERGVYIERNVNAESSEAQPSVQVVGAT